MMLFIIFLFGNVDWSQQLSLSKKFQKYLLFFLVLKFIFLFDENVLKKTEKHFLMVWPPRKL